MKISKTRFDLALAKECMTTVDLRKTISSTTITRIRSGQEVTPRSVGLVAKALNTTVEFLCAIGEKEAAQ